MSENKTVQKSETKTKKNKKLPRTKKRSNSFKINWLLVVVIIFIGLPLGTLGWIVFSASLETGTPQLGDRFEGDLTIKLQDEDLVKIETDILALENVEEVEISMNIITARIYVKVSDTVTKEEAHVLTIAIYDLIDASFPIDIYFTHAGEAVQYDLEVYTYRDLETDDEVFIRLIKNSASETYNIQNVGDPLDPELVDRLYQEYIDSTTDVPEATEGTDEGTDE